MRRKLGVVGLGLAVALVFAGCGGDDDDDGGSASGGKDGSGKKISASDFADDLCGVLSDFAGEAKKSVEQEDVAAIFEGGGDASSIKDLPKMIGALTGMFDDLDRLFGDLTADLNAIGTPDVAGGAEFRQQLLDAMTKGGDLISEAAGKLKETNPDSLEDLSALAPAFEGFEKAFDEVNVDFEKEAPKEVADAIEQSDTCKEAEKKYGEF